MKKMLLCLIGLSLVFLEAKACDLCSIYMNIEPNDLQNSIGFNYRYRLFENTNTSYYTLNTNEKHAIDSPVLTDVNSQQESFNSYDLWANYFIGQQWQVNARMSFVDNYYSENDSILYNVAGPGDLSIVLKNLVFNTKVTDSSKLAIRWLLGGGVKLPTGNFNKSNMVTPSSSVKGNVVYGSPYEELDPHFQPGTGSLDFLAVSEFLIRYRGVGLATNLSYRWNTENKNEFRFANRFNATATAFYLYRFLKKYAIAPSLGLDFEFANRDEFKGKSFENSGGIALFSTFGTKVYLNKIALGFTYFNPIKQQLNDKQLPNKKRITGDLTYYF